MGEKKQQLMCNHQGCKVTRNVREERHGGLHGRISSTGWQEAQRERRNETYDMLLKIATMPCKLT